MQQDITKIMPGLGIILVIAVTACAMSGCLSEVSTRDDKNAIAGAVTLGESRLIAEHYILEMKEYREYEGRNLTLLDTAVLRCPSCWKFEYIFEMTSLKDPAFTDRAVVGVTVQSGKITDVVATYGLK